MDVNKCYNCGKNFKDNAHLEQHKKRKTPCLIREVPPDQIRNPNRCVYCNKIFCNADSLKRHLKTCKIKNGGMEILVDKVRYEQEIRILKEQAAARDQITALLLHRKDMEVSDLKEKVAEYDQALVYVLKRLDKIEDASMAVAAIPKNINNNAIDNSVNKTINNTQINNNQQVHFHINNYDSPNMDGLVFSLDEISKSGKLLDLSLQKLYFNPDKPENHSLYVSNKKEGDVVAFDNGWYLYQKERAREVAIVAMKKASDVSMNVCMHYEYAGMNDFLNASPATQEVIREFTRSINDLPLDMLDIERHPTDSFYQIAISNRAVVIKTIKDSGCKLIK